MERAMTRLVLILQAAALFHSALLTAPVANAGDCGCEPFTHCDDCDSVSCCSPVRYCGSTGAYCDRNYCSTDICYVPPPSLNLPAGLRPYYRLNGTNESTINVDATYSHDLDVNTVEDFCGRGSHADLSSSFSGLAAFCTSTASEDVCGLCLKVTNRDNGKQAKVRVVHKRCSYGSLVLDYSVFLQVEPRDNGDGPGHLPVSYEFVNCSMGN